MNEKIYSVVLSNGTELNNLTLNGNTFISKNEIKKEVFDDNLWNVTIRSVDGSETFSNMKLAYYNFDAVHREYQFTLLLPTSEEMEKKRLWSAIEYLSMMTGINY